MDTYHMNQHLPYDTFKLGDESGAYHFHSAPLHALGVLGDETQLVDIYQAVNRVLPTSERETVYRFKESEAMKSVYAEKLLNSDAKKVNSVELRMAALNGFEMMGLNRDEIANFLDLISNIKECGLDKSAEYVELVSRVEVFLKLSSRGDLSIDALFEKSTELLKTIDSIASQLDKEKGKIADASRQDVLIKELEQLNKSVCTIKCDFLERKVTFYKFNSSSRRSPRDSKIILEETGEMIKEISACLPFLEKESLKDPKDPYLTRSVEYFRQTMSNAYEKYNSELLNRDITSLMDERDSFEKLISEKKTDPELLLIKSQKFLDDADMILPIWEAKEAKMSGEAQQRESDRIAKIKESREKALNHFFSSFSKTVEEDWGSSEASMIHFSGLFRYVCGRNVDSEEEGEKRYAKLETFVKEMINKWTPHGNSEVERNCPETVAKVANALKEQLVSEKTMPILLSYMFPQMPLNQVALDVSNPKSILANISKTVPSLSNIAPRFFDGLDQMMGDVIYWACRAHADSLESFKLCCSDMHDRGLGACMVTFANKKGRKEYVIKPDEKRFEKLILGRGGFSTQFNTLISAHRAKYGGEELAGSVRTFDMHLSEDKTRHGTLVRKIDGTEMFVKYSYEYNLDGLVEKRERIVSQVLCGFFGITDMNKENVLYEKLRIDEAKLIRLYKPALIDAECGIDIRSLGDFVEASEQTGFAEYNELMKEFKYSTLPQGQLSVDDKFFKVLYEGYIRKLFDPAEDMRCRIVPIKTEDYEACRLGALKTHHYKMSLNRLKPVIQSLNGSVNLAQIQELDEGDKNLWKSINLFIEQWTGYESKMNNTKLMRQFINLNGRGPIFNSSNEQMIKAIECAMLDFSEGKIPFYEIRIATGELITHGGTVVGQYMPGMEKEERVLMMKKLMIRNIVVEGGTEGATPALDLLDDKGRLTA